MIKNYIKTAFRNLRKNTSFTLINVLGLALGLSICLLIVFYVIDELSYDKYNVKASRIYRITNDIKIGGTTASYAVEAAPTASAMVNGFPEVENAVRFRQWGGFTIKKGNSHIMEYRAMYADPSIFNVFTLPMLDGTPDKALAEPNSMVITESTARKYFNRTNVVGQTLMLNDTSLFKITGVIKDIPQQSHFNVDFIASMASTSESKFTSWLSNENFNTYVLLKPGSDPRQVEAKFPGFVRRTIGAELMSILHKSYDDVEKGGDYFRLSLTPLTDIHLKSNRVAEMSANGNIQYVYIFSIVAVFVLLIACVNFMNLSTARSANRAREVGVRKVLGSNRKNLIAQFLAESMMVTLIAAVLAVLLAWVLLPAFNELSGKQLMISMQVAAWLIPCVIFMVLIIGVLAGSYPAFYLSRFQPVAVLKGRLSSGFKNSWFRSLLVVFQFFISVFLIIGTLVIYNQLRFIQNKDLGYNRNQILIIKNTSALGNKAKAFKNEIKQLSGVVNVTLTGYTPVDGYRNNNTFFQDESRELSKTLHTQTWYVDKDYVNTMGMKLVEGRNFSDKMATDTAGIIINETAARMIGSHNVINKKLFLPADNTLRQLNQYHVIGVVKDFNFSSLRENITPVAIIMSDDFGALSIHVNTTDLPAMLSQIESRWKAIAPNQEFVYSFLDQDFDNLYRSEQQIGQIFVVFTTLAIIIACLGLFGLAAYAAEQRTKEIGIRKVLGANLSAIVNMLSVDFIKLVIISIAIASPLAWLAMQHWLQSFAYRQNVQWWVVAIAGALAILIAFITISFQSVKAALTNPIKSLRAE